MIKALVTCVLLLPGAAFCHWNSEARMARLRAGEVRREAIAESRRARLEASREMRRIRVEASRTMREAVREARRAYRQTRFN